MNVNKENYYVDILVSTELREKASMYLSQNSSLFLEIHSSKYLYKV